MEQLIKFYLNFISTYFIFLKVLLKEVQCAITYSYSHTTVWNKVLVTVQCAITYSLFTHQSMEQGTCHSAVCHHILPIHTPEYGTRYLSQCSVPSHTPYSHATVWNKVLVTVQCAITYSLFTRQSMEQGTCHSAVCHHILPIHTPEYGTRYLSQCSVPSHTPYSHTRVWNKVLVTVQCAITYSLFTHQSMEQGTCHSAVCHHILPIHTPEYGTRYLSQCSVPSHTPYSHTRVWNKVLVTVQCAITYSLFTHQSMEQGTCHSSVCHHILPIHTPEYGTRYLSQCSVTSHSPHSHTRVWNKVLVTVQCAITYSLFTHQSMEQGTCHSAVCHHILPIHTPEYGTRYLSQCSVTSHTPYSHTRVWNKVLVTVQCAITYSLFTHQSMEQGTCHSAVCHHILPIHTPEYGTRYLSQCSVPSHTPYSHTRVWNKVLVRVQCAITYSLFTHQSMEQGTCHSAV